MRPMAASRIALTGAAGLTAAAGGFRQTALDHGGGGGEELFEQFFLTHGRAHGRVSILIINIS